VNSEKKLGLYKGFISYALC